MRKLTLVLVAALATLTTNAQKLIKLEGAVDTVVVSEDRLLKVWPLTDSTARVDYINVRGNKDKFSLVVSADSIVARSAKFFYISDSSVALNAAFVLSAINFDQGSSIINYQNFNLKEKITNPSVSPDSLAKFVNAR